MNISWGYKITALYSSFALFIFIMVYKSSTLNTELVTKDYYAAEIAYQQRIDATRNSKALKQQVAIKYVADGQQVVVDFPEVGNNITGSALLFRPASAADDRKLAVKVADGEALAIPAADLAKGLWRLELAWQAGGTDYYNEEVIVIP